MTPTSRKSTAQRRQSQAVRVGVDEALGLAIRLHREGRLEAALEIYRQVLQMYPNHPDALHFLGVLSHQLGKSQEAVELICKAIRLVPTHADAHNNLGNVFREQGRLDEAAAAYRAAIALNPDHADAYNNLGTVLRAQGQLEESMAAYERAIALKPEHAEAYLNLGNVFKKLGKMDEAIQAYLKTITFKRYPSEAYCNFGSALYAAGRIAEAADVYQKWLNCEPTDPVAQHMLAACSGKDVPVRATDAYIRALFNRFADSFDDKLAQLEYQAPELVGKVVAEELGVPRQQSDVMDAGCGTGLCARHLRPYARRLVGVDLAPGMIEKARARGVYDELVTAEMTEHLRSRGSRYDLIVAADALVYFGELQPVFTAAGTALRPGGRLIFTVEHAAQDDAALDFSINPHGRYSHSEGYVRRTLEAAGLAVRAITHATLRNEIGKPVAGLVVSAHKP